MLRDFVAIDFETANNERSSVCSVGLVVVKNGTITDKIYELIKPEPNYYSFWNTQVHGINYQDTINAPVFASVWESVSAKINGLPLVAHNRPFDEGCLRAAFKTYMMDYPDYIFYCTLQAARRQFPHLPNHKLSTVAAHCGFDLLKHHHALADAEACAAIAIHIL